jgi:hypothetical protein
MSQLIGVHGIGKQYRGRQQILDEWTSALADGIEWAAGHAPAEPPDLDVVFYGRLFRSAEEATGKGPAGSQDEAELTDLDAEELSELTAAVQEIVSPDDLANSEAGIGRDKALMWLPIPVQRLVGAIERCFPRSSGLVVLSVLRQVRRYLRDAQTKAEIDRITAAAADGCTVLIGHSLGSVVAYEYLRQNPGQPVKLLLTVGSPLGLRMVRDRLPPGQPSIAKWVDVRDPHDPVAAAGALGRWYPGVLDGHADNGLESHAAERYLSSKAVGRALIEVLPKLGQ